MNYDKDATEVYTVPPGFKGKPQPRPLPQPVYVPVPAQYYYLPALWQPPAEPFSFKLPFDLTPRRAVIVGAATILMTLWVFGLPGIGWVLATIYLGFAIVTGLVE